MYYEMYRDGQNFWRWRLRSAGNHKIIADSAEAYWNEADCLHGINLVKSSYNAPVYKL